MVDDRRIGVPEWIEEVSDVTNAPLIRIDAADGHPIRRLVELQDISVSEDQVTLHHTRPLYTRFGTLVLQHRDGSISRLELRLFWTRFSADQTYHTVGVIRRAWPLPRKVE